MIAINVPGRTVYRVKRRVGWRYTVYRGRDWRCLYPIGTTRTWLGAWLMAKRDAS